MFAFSLREELKALKAQLAAVVRERDELARQLEASRFDPLTGLLRRREFHDVLRGRLKEGQEGTLFLLDLDAFKRFNDKFGHAAGDVLIQRVAARLSAWATPHTLVTRYGGEEFGVFVPHVAGTGAWTVCEKLLELCRQPHAIDGSLHTVTVSIGFAECRSQSPDEYHARADMALYAAKHRGRDQGVSFCTDVETIPAARRQLASVVVDLQRELMTVRDEARTDALTGLPNRRALEEAVATIQASDPTPLGIVFVDLDHFGVINHAQGDAAGDQVLRQVARALRTAVRQDDLVFRKGGEEFAVLMPGVTGDAATQAATRLLDAIRALHIPNQGGTGGPHLTATLGVCGTDGEVAYWTVLERAGAVAMQAKDMQARNAVHAWQPQAPSIAPSTAPA